MNHIILDFEGERITITYTVSTMQAFSALDVKFDHNGNSYSVTDRVIIGVAKQQQAFAEWDKVNAIPDMMDILFTLKKT